MIGWIPAYIALGSNSCDPVQQVGTALLRLAQIKNTRLIVASRLYRSRPMGPQDQPDFINAAAGLLTQLSPGELLAELKHIEQSMGRLPPAVRWGPRLIDLDLLLQGSEPVDQPGLQLPHPGLHERNFVIHPLAEIAPSLRIAGHGTVSELAKRLGSEGLTVVSTADQQRSGRDGRGFST